MKYIIIALMFMCSVANADTLKIPFECYPKQVQEKFAERGYKLELNGENREPDTFGFIVNKGDSYEIYTYKPLTDDQLNDILEIING